MPIVLNGSGPITGVTSLNTTVSDTEIGYLDGVTSALQTQINTAGGLVKITDSTFSGSSAVNINNCFSSTYVNYRVVIRTIADATREILLRLRASGSDITDQYYKAATGYLTSDTASNSAQNFTGNISLGYGGSTDPLFVSLDFHGPQASVRKSMVGTTYGLNSAATAFWTQNIGAGRNNTSSVDGFSVYPASGNITGYLAVYGYRA